MNNATTPALHIALDNLRGVLLAATTVGPGGKGPRFVDALIAHAVRHQYREVALGLSRLAKVAKRNDARTTAEAVETAQRALRHATKARKAG